MEVFLVEETSVSADIVELGSKATPRLRTLSDGATVLFGVVANESQFI